MASNVLNVGQSALLAAQIGISTTGHNIANAKTPGYTRQIVIQSAAQAQNFGAGFLGQGTLVSGIQRQYSELLTTQVFNGQSSTGELSTYASQMSQIDNLLADTEAGLSPTLQSFFESVQAAAANPGDTPTRQTLLSNAQSLASRFRSLGDRLDEISQNVNSQLSSSVGLVNSYAKQISQLNSAIENAQVADGNAPNDLLDQRDQLISELSKQIKVNVVNQDGVRVNVFIGNGLPLVVGKQTYALSAINSPTDPTRLELAIATNSGGTAILGSSSISGGTIGGLVQFREQSLDSIRSQLGMVAVGLAETFNAQHAQALDSSGAPGGTFFTAGAPLSTASTNNTGNAVVATQISNVAALTGSNYKLQYDGTNYTVTRLSDNTSQNFTSLPQTVDGLSIGISGGTIAANDEYLIKPTTQGASQFALAITNVSKIALGAPALSSAANASNTGAATITAPTVSSTYSASPLGSAFTLAYNSAGAGTLTGFPATLPVTVTNGSSVTNYAAGAPVTYVAGATYTVGGVSFTVTGAPNNGDQFTVTPTTSNGKGDNRNALLLAALQSKSTMLSGTASYEGVFGQLVSSVGNKTNELLVTSKAEASTLEYSIAQQQSESGVNLDEEAANLLRYQQAYQAAGKLMQIAKEMFDTLISLG